MKLFNTAFTVMAFATSVVLAAPAADSAVKRAEDYVDAAGFTIYAAYARDEEKREVVKRAEGMHPVLFSTTTTGVNKFQTMPMPKALLSMLPMPGMVL
jgi:2-methylisocitrate lyase-like PEP mutase family enzyme